MRIGLISDTHGLLRPEAIEALRRAELIVHAGDVGELDILESLRSIAPIVAVRGNVDREPWAEALPESATFEVRGLTIHVVHDRATLAVNPVDAGIDVVVYGHSHKPLIERAGRVLFVNPGSAGPRRFRLPVTLASMIVTNGRADAEILTLQGAE